MDHTIDINELTSKGVVIGRQGDITIGRTTPKGIRNKISRFHATIYTTPAPDRPRPDVWIRDGAVNADGEWVPSGVGIWVAGDGKLTADKPHQLRPGARVNIVPIISGYQCVLEWEPDLDTTPSGNPHFPTLPTPPQTLAFENRILKEEVVAKDWRIEELQDGLKKMQKVSRSIEAQMKEERATNRKQDKKIRQLAAIGIVIAGALVISYGVDVEEVERLLDVVVGVASIAGVVVAVKA